MSFGFKSHGMTETHVFGHNDTDAGNPAGGYAASYGQGKTPSDDTNKMLHDSEHPTHFAIRWQDGPINREAGETANGALIEDILEVCARRLEFYQDSPFACRENESALDCVRTAIDELLSRRKDRRARGVEGKHEA